MSKTIEFNKYRTVGAYRYSGCDRSRRLGPDQAPRLFRTGRHCCANPATRCGSVARRRQHLAAVDFNRPHTLHDALRGADRLFVSHGTSPQQLVNEIALIDAAVAAGVRHIVKLSALGPASRLNPFAWHMQIEAHLAKQPVASTCLAALGIHRHPQACGGPNRRRLLGGRGGRGDA